MYDSLNLLLYFGQIFRIFHTVLAPHCFLTLIQRMLQNLKPTVEFSEYFISKLINLEKVEVAWFLFPVFTCFAGSCCFMRQDLILEEPA